MATHVLLPIQLLCELERKREMEKESNIEGVCAHLCSGRCICVRTSMHVCACVLYRRSQGGKRVPEGDHPGRKGGGRRTGRGKVRLMMLGKTSAPAGPDFKDSGS